jgi:hypothetical protein
MEKGIEDEEENEDEHEGRQNTRRGSRPQGDKLKEPERS